ncbi:hypothetical protein ACHAXA_000480, partial [Cyclostephanos tholiformis]
EEGNTPVVTASAASASAPAAKATPCERGIIRSDLGVKPIMIKCGHCNQTGMTKTKGSFGACSFGSAFAFVKTPNILVAIAENSSVNRMRSVVYKFRWPLYRGKRWAIVN